MQIELFVLFFYLQISFQPKMKKNYRLRYGKEIKTRFYYLFFSCCISFLISLYFSEQIIYFLSLPLKQAYEQSYNFSGNEMASDIMIMQGGQIDKSKPSFIFTELTEAFFTRIQVSGFMTFYCFFFLFNYQFWLYLKPGLFEFEK